MGSPEDEAGHAKDEVPRHVVAIDNPFWLGKYEITQAQWRAVMGSNPSEMQTGDDHPVENVSWKDCQEYLRRLNNMGEWKFRLPAEAEWEYACRAGSDTAWCCGNKASCVDAFAWHAGNSGKAHHSVGQKEPNAWGLSDMHGNVYEWCQDQYSEDYRNASDSGEAWNRATGKVSYVRRGGSWAWPANNGRSAFRGSALPDNRRNDSGLRLVLDGNLSKQAPRNGTPEVDRLRTVAASFHWDAPVGWEQGPEKPMRLVTYLTQGRSCEFRVYLLEGEGGGLEANLNRWRLQMGQTQLSADEIAALPRKTVLGRDAAYIEITGDYSGISGKATPGQMLLGLVCQLDGQSLLVVMNGPEAQMALERDNFAAFCASLR